MTVFCDQAKRAVHDALGFEADGAALRGGDGLRSVLWASLLVLECREAALSVSTEGWQNVCAQLLMPAT